MTLGVIAYSVSESKKLVLNMYMYTYLSIKVDQLAKFKTKILWMWDALLHVQHIYMYIVMCAV